MARITFLGAPMDSLTMAETVSQIETKIQKNEFLQHVVVNVAKLVHMQSDKELAESVKACDMINIDGMGVVLGARFCGHTVPERIAGVDLFHELLAMSAEKSLPIFLLGAKEDVLQKTVETVKKTYPNLSLAGYHHGYFWGNNGKDEQVVVDKIKTSGAKLLFVAITSPKKENFINKWQNQLGVNFVMGVGGTFDVVSGTVKRAPKWMQNYGLEWFYRIMQEPRRMWKRYLVTNIQFLFLLIKERFFINKSK